MPLPDVTATRRPIHARNVFYQSFLRDDGLIDIEGSLVDRLAAHRNGDDGEELVHHMLLRVTVEPSLKIVALATALDHYPFPPCVEVNPAYQSLVGETIGPGWRELVRRHVGRTQGCTHLSELFTGLATAAYLAVSLRPAIEGADVYEAWRHSGRKPYFLDGCHSWRLDGIEARRRYPEYAKPGAEEPAAARQTTVDGP